MCVVTKMARKTMEERQTIIKLKNVGLSYREIAQKVKVSVITASFTIKMHYKTGANSDRIMSGRAKATTESDDNFRKLTACIKGG